MTVFIAHAPADAPAAEALERFLERRGLFAELETGERGFRVLGPADVVVALISRDTVFSPRRLLFEKRALEAWAEERLVMVKLDRSFPPVGLRDLESIDAAFEPQRDIAWAAVTRLAQEIATGQTRGRAEVAAPGAPPPAAAPAPVPQARRAEAPLAPEKGAPQNWAVGAVLMLAAVAFLVAVTLFGADAVSVLMQPLGERFIVLHAVGAGLALLVFLVLFIGVLKRVRAEAADGAAMAEEFAWQGSRERAISTKADGGALFVSYAHADEPMVRPVVTVVREQGGRVWMDDNIGAGEGWAGEIVRAIRGCDRVIVMCSSRAFESDHVKREVYLADRYKKPLVPMFLEAAPPPEDFEYFFAGVQWVELYKSPPEQRSEIVIRALKAA